MKYNKIRFVLSVAFASFAVAASAQESSDASIAQQDSKVNVAFREVAQEDLMGGVTVVDVEEMQDKNYTTYSLTNLESLVPGWTGGTLWGSDEYLVLVNGVPRDANNVMPSEIKEITFMKGAQAVVLYGSRAAKGAILITTKKGKVQDLQIDVRANTGFHIAKSFPEYLSSAEYMTLYNEAYLNDGNSISTLPYSEEDIYHSAAGTNPYRYPDLDFYSDEYINKAYNVTDGTVEITGGNERAQYYSNVNYYRQGDFVDFGEAENNFTDRFSVRGNVDLNINKYITAYVGANTTFYNAQGAHGSYWSEAATMRPNRISPLIPLEYIDENALSALETVGTSSNIIDGKYFLAGTTIVPDNIYGDYYAAGYQKFTSRQFQFDTGINVDLSSVIKGLSFNTQFAIDYATSYVTQFNNDYAVFIPTWSNYNGTDVIVGLTQEGLDKKSGTQNVSSSSSRRTTMFTAQFNYNRTFGGVHNVSSALVANGYQRLNTGNYYPINNTNMGFQLSYNYDKKYYADFGLGGIYSTKLPEENRIAFSPSLTLGWRALNNAGIVDDLVVSASGSILNTDLDITDYYMYESNYVQGGWFSWSDGLGYEATYPTVGSNQDMGYIQRKELSANVRASLFKGMITAEASAFATSVEGILTESTNLLPSYFTTYYPDASFVPYINYNNDLYTGVDFSVQYNKTFGDVKFNAGIVGMYYVTEATQRSENNEYDYQNRQGRSLNGYWGYVSDGLFQSEAEIADAPTQNLGSTVMPGDIKYVNQNGDDVIDSKDMVYLGSWVAPLNMGVNVSVSWKNFTLYALGTANFGGYGIKNSSYYWVSGDDKYSAAVRDRWTPETAETATYPRLSTESGSNNFTTSDYWMYKTDRFNLTKVQLTYDFPSKMFNNGSFIKDASVYASGSNLLTIAKEAEHMEMSVGSSPQTRFYNLGVKVTF